LYSLPFRDIIKHVVVNESVQYREALVPRVRNPGEQKKHTVMTILPKDELASLFLNWTKELQT
jgi:hypothetical protein